MHTTARVPLPWAERGDGEGDKISRSLDNREICISTPTKNRKEEFTRTKNKVRERKVEPDSKQNKSHPSNTTISLLIYLLSYPQN